MTKPLPYTLLFVTVFYLVKVEIHTKFFFNFKMNFTLLRVETGDLREGTLVVGMDPH